MATSGNSPVDNATYNLMQALVSKLEAIEAYGRYAQDEGGELFRELIEEERTHADRLLEQLRGRLRG
jgi:rubrerythrin